MGHCRPNKAKRRLESDLKMLSGENELDNKVHNIKLAVSMLPHMADQRQSLDDENYQFYGSVEVTCQAMKHDTPWCDKKGLSLKMKTF